MLRSERYPSLRRILALVSLACVMGAVHASCEGIDVPSQPGPSVPVYGLPVEGTVDPNVVKDQYLVILPAEATSKDRQDVERRIGAWQNAGASILTSYDYETLQGFVAVLPPDVLAQVRYFSDIAWIEANRTGSRTGLQTCPPGNLDVIDQHAPVDGAIEPNALLDQAYAYDRTGLGVHVLIVDTGLDKTSAPTDFKHWEDGAGANWFVSMCESDDATHGHGTMVAEVIAGKKYGVAKEATIVGFNVANYGCRNSDTSCNPKPKCGKFAPHMAPDWCDGECFDGTNCNTTSCDSCTVGPSIADDAAALAVIASKLATLPRPLVIVYPHAFDGTSPAIEDQVKNIVAGGAIFVTGAGNDGRNPCGVSPARLSATEEGVITVGSLKWEHPVQLRHENSCVDVYAPGVKVATKRPTTTCGAGNDYVADAEGSSFAAAHAAGVIALMLEEDPSTASFKTNRFNRQATRWLTLNGGRRVPLLHNPYNVGESEKIDMDMDNDADGYEDMISCTPAVCAVCDSMGRNTCNDPQGTCSGRLRCTDTECAPCGREGNRCCTIDAACDGNLACKNGFCACGEEEQACCNVSGAKTCNAGLVCNSADKCVDCGAIDHTCCNDSGVQICDAGLICNNNTCVDCGGKDDPCCTNGGMDTCDRQDLVCRNGTCKDACVVTCCDPDMAPIVLDQPDATKCKEVGGTMCFAHDGPTMIEDNGSVIWGPETCPSLQPTTAHCCNGDIFDLGMQFDLDIAKAAGGKYCQEAVSTLREIRMNGNVEDHVFFWDCGNCTAYCCDETLAEGTASSANACIFYIGTKCRDNGGGPISITYNDSIVWGAEVGAQCGTVRQCSARCNNGVEESYTPQFSKSFCGIWLEAYACNDPGETGDAGPCTDGGTCGIQAMFFDGVQFWPPSP